VRSEVAEEPKSQAFAVDATHAAQVADLFTAVEAEIGVPEVGDLQCQRLGSQRHLQRRGPSCFPGSDRIGHFSLAKRKPLSEHLYRGATILVFKSRRGVFVGFGQCLSPQPTNLSFCRMYLPETGGGSQRSFRTVHATSFMCLRESSTLTKLSHFFIAARFSGM
jgi:hypothetical protein